MRSSTADKSESSFYYSPAIALISYPTIALTSYPAIEL